MNNKYIIIVYDKPQMIDGVEYQTFIEKMTTDHLNTLREYKARLEEKYPGKKIKMKVKKNAKYIDFNF